MKCTVSDSQKCFVFFDVDRPQNEIKMYFGDKHIRKDYLAEPILLAFRTSFLSMEQCQLIIGTNVYLHIAFPGYADDEPYVDFRIAHSRECYFDTFVRIDYDKCKDAVIEFLDICLSEVMEPRIQNVLISELTHHDIIFYLGHCGEWLIKNTTPKMTEEEIRNALVKAYKQKNM